MLFYSNWTLTIDRIYLELISIISKYSSGIINLYYKEYDPKRLAFDINDFILRLMLSEQHNFLAFWSWYPFYNQNLCISLLLFLNNYLCHCCDFFRSGMFLKLILFNARLNTLQSFDSFCYYTASILGDCLKEV